VRSLEFCHVARSAALGNLENRPVGQHDHAVNDPGHSHNVFRAADAMNNSFAAGLGETAPEGVIPTTSDSTGITVAAAGAVPGTTAPYVQLQICEKL
jgi:hypothetical protein